MINKTKKALKEKKSGRRSKMCLEIKNKKEKRKDKQIH